MAQGALPALHDPVGARGVCLVMCTAASRGSTRGGHPCLRVKRAAGRSRV